MTLWTHCSIDSVIYIRLHYFIFKFDSMALYFNFIFFIYFDLIYLFANLMIHISPYTFNGLDYILDIFNNLEFWP